MRRLELAGQRFSRLLAIEPVRIRPRSWDWRCRCDCGTMTTVPATSLVGGNTKSCGCFQRESRGQASRTHGLRHTSEFKSWCAMRQRCNNPKDKSYPQWGGRGIVVCERWQHSFTNFIADMGMKPTPLYSIDRIDNNGPYTPENCRWATRAMQMKNMSRNTPLTLHGRTQLLIEWSRELGIKASTICVRLYRHGWSVERALTEPLQAERWAMRRSNIPKGHQE